MCTTIRPNVRVFINLIFLFAHDHSTKVRGHSYSFIHSFLNCANISFAVLPLYFFRYNHTLIFRTMYSWKYCSYISYTISMTIWSLGPLYKAKTSYIVLALQTRATYLQRSAQYCVQYCIQYKNLFEIFRILQNYTEIWQHGTLQSWP